MQIVQTIGTVKVMKTVHVLKADQVREVIKIISKKDPRS